MSVIVLTPVHVDLVPIVFFSFLVELSSGLGFPRGVCFGTGAGGRSSRVSGA